MISYLAGFFKEEEKEKRETCGFHKNTAVKLVILPYAFLMILLLLSKKQQPRLLFFKEMIK